MLGCGSQGFSARDLRPHMAMARPPQERAQTRQVLPVCVRLKVRLSVREPLPLRAGGVAWHRLVWADPSVGAVAVGEGRVHRGRRRARLQHGR